MKTGSVLSAVLALVLFAGCGTAERYAGLYGLGGGVLGAGLGAAGSVVTGGHPAKGAYIGGLAGAAVGAAYGYDKGLAAERQQAAIAAAQAAAAPVERCSWSYDHNGMYAYRCDGSVTRPHVGPPQTVLPAPRALTPAPPAPIALPSGGRGI